MRIKMAHIRGGWVGGRGGVGGGEGGQPEESLALY